MTTRIATAAGAGPETRYFVPFAKVEEQADGSVYVEGIATGEVLDFHGEVVSYEASKAAFAEWSDWAEKATDGASIGNIRAMHQPIVAGRAVKWWADDATRSIHLGATIDDPAQAKLCRTRAYTGFSIGGDTVVREMRTWEGKPAPWIMNYRLSENSVVDKPACPTATFTLVKRATKENTVSKPIDFLKAHLGAVLLAAAAMPDKNTVQIGDTTIKVVEKESGIDVELRKDAASAVIAGTEALSALKKFLIEVVGIDGDPDMWTIGDVCEALRYCYSARMGAQYAVSENVAAAANPSITKSETPADPPPADDKPAAEEKPVEEAKPKDEDPAPPAPAAEDVPPSTESGTVENVVKAQLAPVLQAVTKLATSIEPLVKAFNEGALMKGAGTEAKGEVLNAEESEGFKKLSADVGAIKTLVEQLPAPPAGRRVLKAIGESTPEVVQSDKYAEIVETAIKTAAAAGASKSVLDAMRLDLATEAFRRT